MKHKKQLYINIVLLILAAFFTFFSNGRWSFAFAAWMFPIFILRFTRKQKPLKGYIIVAIILSVCSQLAFLRFSSYNPKSFLFYLPALLGFLYGGAFLLDRLLYYKYRGFIATLIFPLAYTSIDYIYASLSPMGSTGALGYSQYRILPLVQLVSITGLWGLTFLITWFGSTVTYIWDNLDNKNQIKKAILIYGTIISLVFVYGGIRLIKIPKKGTVRIAGIHTYDLRNSEGKQYWKAAEDDWEYFREITKELQDKTFEATIREARAGAKIVLWSEVLPIVAKEDESKLLKKAKSIAREENIYLLMSLFSEHQDTKEKDENKLIMVDPHGDIVLSHYKFGGNFIEGTVKGDGNIHTVDTPYGKISGVICWDQNFPRIIRQAGQKNVDIMLAPTADWREIDPLHTIVGYFRAVENGYSLFRQSINGLSLATDPKGNIIASMDHFQSSEWVTVAQVPINGVKTIYSGIGDVFAWISIIALILMIVLRKKYHKKDVY